ncbi:S6 family peptidase [uncultured Aggregatibacter sp.]|mgnify:CR=1 FL=1|uniref:S6 family peptidase n=1 Tax=uncultured Aggregatibacter sp. TaxID=470564 RepID=UPI0025FB0A37|nr:S6 family peptidase [uncultured Aggregatibacter sp.]
MKNQHLKPSYLTVLTLLGLHFPSLAGIVRNDIDYQYFRDFAENKGQFFIGNHDIDIRNKAGQSIGTMMQNGIPMIDFSPVSHRWGVATLIGDQYVVSVAHNGRYQDVDFGSEGHNPDAHRYSYRLVQRNNYPEGTKYNADYHTPRLNKFVTETAPIEMVKDLNGDVYSDVNKYPMRVRMGAGLQFTRNQDGSNVAMSGVYAYNYLTGGNAFIGQGTENGLMNLGGELMQKNAYGPMPIIGSSGDSGSPLFVYDKEKGKWLLNGVLVYGVYSSGDYQKPDGFGGNGYLTARYDYYQRIAQNDRVSPIISQQGNRYLWTSKGDTGNITLNNTPVATTPLFASYLPNQNMEEPSLSHGKNLVFSNKTSTPTIIQLTNSINQGAGGLYFEGGNYLVETTLPDITWNGAGVSVSEGSTVTWKIKNPVGDRLSKIGQGTLLVNGKGENLGDISVGDGLVVLNQQADEQNKKQAFNQLGIVSGRPTVKLESADQVNPNNIYFGFRGGRLDLNGNTLTFNRIQNTDEGAQIVNHNKDKEANVTILGNAQIDNEKDINQSKATAFNGWFGETNAALHNGRLNLHYQLKHADSVFLLSGGTNLNGDITQESGTLVFSGRPTPHAYNHLNQPALIGRPQGEVVQDDDWLNRTFKADNFIINDGSAVVSRNVSEISGNWQLSKYAKVTFGVTDKQVNFICARSDWTGLTKCDNQTLSDKAFRSIERTKIKGSLSASGSATLLVQGLADVVGSVMLSGFSRYHLTHNATQTGMLHVNNRAVATVDNATLAGDVWLSDMSTFNLVNTGFTHQIRGKNPKHTSVSLSDNAHWTLPESTRVGNLSLDNSQITLNPDFTTQKDNQTFNTLEVLGDLDGNGTINYRTYLQENKGDHVIVRGKAAGNFVLNVRNTGAEPQNLAQLSLLELNNPAQSDDVNVSLANGSVDAGAYRYELRNDDFDYRLYNPKKEKELADQERIAEEKRKAEEAARLAEANRKADVKTEQKDLISRYSNSALSELSASANNVLLVLDELNKQLVGENLSHVWVNTMHSSRRYDANEFRAYKQETHLTQLGAQHIDDNYRLGLLFSHARANNIFDDNIGSKNRLTMLSAFGKYDFANGLNVFADMSYGSSTGEIRGELQNADIQRHIVALGAGVGYQLKLGKLAFKPNASVHRYHISSEDYQYDQSRIHTPSANFNVYQAGVTVDYTFGPWAGVMLRPFVSVNYVDASDSKLAVQVNQIPLMQRFDRYWQQEIGLSAGFGGWQVGGYAAQSRGKQLDKQHQFGLKVGYHW